MEQVRLLKGDNRELLKTLEDNSIDSVITDPPYALTSIKNRFGKPGSAEAQYGTDGAFQRASKGFMGKEWDSEVPSVELWKEVLRVLKPGGHVLSFGGTRTYHHMVMNMELAGFEIRDSISYMYGSGFPKSHNIGKAVDKLNGNEREVVGTLADIHPRYNSPRKGGDIYGDGFGESNTAPPLTKGNSEWEGWGTALKPSMELICLARKPLTEKSIAENVLKHGTGGINIDGCRIGYVSEADKENTINAKYTTDKDNKQSEDWGTKQIGNVSKEEGRFPANTILECICDEPHTNPECPCYILDKQSGVSKTTKRTNFKKNNTMWQEKDDDGNTMSGGFDDKGGASRFFYTAKVSKKERNMGLDEFKDKKSGSYHFRQDASLDGKTTQPNKNTHPTVKPINLMTYLCRLITPPNGVVLDMYMGSGSTGISALLEGFKFIGMEMDEDYFNIAETRINNFEQYRQFKK
jgi:site-specific DNA-methyltransferase (adenine-specific)